ncbi:MAG: SurA N-terminal domain-containing protein [Planctomycetota bacterium]|nr:SurA N-terminal domain-containing protein [Planctomycetota bacterium]
MNLFRRKQKLIFWIVTIIIVPSFVVVWGVSGRYTRSDDINRDFGRVNGEPLEFHEFDSFRKRLQAAVGGFPIQVAGAPDNGTADSELWKYLFAYAILKDAEKADIRVADLQIGTFLDIHPAIAGTANKDDSQARTSAVDNFCRQMQISRAEFLRGVREWNLIGNYLAADSSLAAVNDDLVFAFYAMNKAECVIKRVRAPELEADRETAKREISERPAEELEQAVRAHVENRSADIRYREPSGWRLSYVLIPFVSTSSIPRPGEVEAENRYEADRLSLYPGKTFEEAREQVVASLVRDEAERQTLRNLLVDVDPQLRGQGAELPAEELVKLTQLAKYGVIAGDTGPEALSIPDVAAKLPVGSALNLRILLEMLDSQPTLFAKTIDDWKRGFNFDGMIMSDGRQIGFDGRPFKADDGFFRFRILEYHPSVPAVVDGPNGAIRPEIFESVMTDMVGERTAELATERAANLEPKIRNLLEARARGEKPEDRELADEFDQLPDEIIPYIRIVESDEQLKRLPVGDILGPNPYSDGETSGYELVVMLARRLPTREAFAAEPAATRDNYRQMVLSIFLGNAGLSYNQGGPVAVIQPSPTVMGGLVDRFNRGDISIDPAWLRNGDSDG